MSGWDGSEFADLISLLDNGIEPSESALIRLLLRRDAPGVFVDRVSRWSGIFKSSKALAQIVRHPACPRPFAFKALPHLGWRDLAEICRDPHTVSVVRQQAERKILERLVSLTLGEKVALARLATGAVMVALLAEREPSCTNALLDNPRFTEAEAIRMLTSNKEPKCLVCLIRHPVWGRRREVIKAAVISPRVPLGVALGLAASLADSELRELEKSAGVNTALREAAGHLLANRQQTRINKSG